jgi:hypothetical protein
MKARRILMATKLMATRTDDAQDRVSDVPGPRFCRQYGSTALPASFRAGEDPTFHHEAATIIESRIFENVLGVEHREI